MTDEIRDPLGLQERVATLASEAIENFISTDLERLLSDRRGARYPRKLLLEEHAGKFAQAAIAECERWLPIEDAGGEAKDGRWMLLERYDGTMFVGRFSLHSVSKDHVWADKHYVCHAARKCQYITPPEAS